MSSTLQYRPLHVGEKPLSDSLKIVLRQEYGDPIDVILRNDDIKFLRGVCVAGIGEAEVLIAAISKFHEIELKEHF